MNRNDFNWLEALCEDFNCARSLTVWLLVKYCEWDQLVSLSCNPSDYPILYVNGKPLFSSVDKFERDYKITELLRKCSSFPTSFDRQENALRGFYESEELCRVTNIRMRTLRWQMENKLEPSHDDKVWRMLLTETRSVIANILGDELPDYISYKFSSGATFFDRMHLSPMDKMTTRPSATASCYDLIGYDWSKTEWCKSLCREQPNSSLPRIIRGNRFSTVPKTAITDRGICIEPSLNVASQLSVGKILRKRLRAQGIDLKHGQTVHQGLVKAASLKLHVGTIDLSSASDTVSYELVKLVLPEQWFDLLNLLRSPETKIGDTWIRNQKFSSMGNGYTFELETLIFYGLAIALCNCMNYKPRICKVYGDDIIIDTPMADNLIKALQFCGFKINTRKTYVNDVMFRESCGADYFHGTNVRGFYLEELPTEPHEYVALANGIRRMGTNHNTDSVLDARYLRCWFRLIDCLPNQLRRVRGPEPFGDLVLQDTEWRQWNSPRKDGTIKCYRPVFGRESFRSYDEPYWTRGSIIAAATLGSLHGIGDTFHYSVTKQTFRLIPGRFLRRNAEPIGYEVQKVRYYGEYIDNSSFEGKLNRFLRSPDRKR